jgi:DNA-directed RNA polymerase specialized sigma subunit
MDKAFEAWKQKPSPDRMGEFLDKAQPVVNAAIRSYGQGNKALESRARLLIAEAAPKFDPGRGVKLRTYLMTQLQPLTRYAKEYGRSTRVPERVNVDLFSINQQHQDYFDKFGREPSDKELADITGLSMRRIAHVRKFARPEAGESTLVDDEGAIMYPGTEAPDPDKILLEYVHHDLDPVDQKIMEWRTGLYGKKQVSNNEMAKRLNLSPGAVSQRAAKIAARIKDLRDQKVS